MSGKFNMDDYVDVAERIVLFRNKYPEGSLQATVLRYPGDGFPFVVVEARAYRTPDDERPGIGLAWEPMPGRTPFTKDSELMVCETSAWGRAIVAVGAADTKRGIASRNEIQARQNVEDRGQSSPQEPHAAARTSSEASPAASAPGSSAPWFAEFVDKYGPSRFCEVATKLSTKGTVVTDPAQTKGATKAQREAIAKELAADDWNAKANA